MLPIPFYANTRDNVHCIQACLKSVLKFFFPREQFSFRKLDRISAHAKGKWTWNSAWMLYLAHRGVEVIDIGGGFRYETFARSGEQYLRRLWPGEIFAEQRRFSNLKQEQKLARALIRQRRVRLINRPATFHDIRRLFREGYVLLCRINPFVLENKDAYGSHTVTLTDVQRRFVRFHDPGLPPRKNRKVAVRGFLRAMNYPKQRAASLVAVRLRKPGQ